MKILLVVTDNPFSGACTILVKYCLGSLGTGSGFGPLSEKSMRTTAIYKN